MDAVTDGILDVMTRIPDIVTAFGSLGTAGWIAAGVFVVVVGVGAYLVWKWTKDRAVERAQRENEENRQQAEAELPGQVSELERGINDDQSAMRQRVAEIMMSRLRDRITWLDVDTPVHGKYRTGSKWPRGAVIHYTAGRPVMSEDDAKAQLEEMAGKGYGAYLVGDDGRIYAPKVMGMQEVAYHAGQSQWRGVSDLNRICMGIEVSCAGRLEDSRTWWGDVVPSQSIRVVKDEENRVVGQYMAFTSDQEESLLSTLLWHVKYNPEFDIEWVVGHDEISPGRKQDPGGSLSVTMPKFREILRGMV